MKWYYEIRGGHTHVRVFMNGGKCGDLCFRNAEWYEVRQYCPWIQFIEDIEQELRDPAVRGRIQSAIAKRLDVTCPKCGHTDPEARWKAAIRQGDHQGQHIVDVGFHCACGNEFGFEIFHQRP